MSKKLNILLAEDDSNLGFVTKEYLEMNGFSVKWETNGKAALQQFFKGDYDLCVFDVMMPEMDGFQLAGEIRKLNTKVPIIFLTAKTMQDDRITGFKSGADDYITKPFSTEEFLLRVESVLKRSYNQIGDKSDNKGTYHIGKFLFDYQNLQLKIGNIEHTLTRKEADLLKILFLHRNQVLPRDTALRIVWGNDDYFTGRSMDVFITRIRKFLKEDPNIQIANIHGIGFKMIVDE